MQSSIGVPSSTGVAAPGRTYVAPETAEDALLASLILLSRTMRQRLASDSLDFAVVGLLRTLEVHGALRLSALAAALQLDASTVSRHVKQLEERRLVERTSDPDDGRASRVALSPAGHTALVQHVERRKALMSSMLQSWDGADRELLRVILDRLNRELSDS